jgi:hypothetical protein
VTKNPVQNNLLKETYPAVLSEWEVIEQKWSDLSQDCKDKYPLEVHTFIQNKNNDDLHPDFLISKHLFHFTPGKNKVDISYTQGLCLLVTIFGMDYIMNIYRGEIETYQYTLFFPSFFVYSSTAL